MNRVVKLFLAIARGEGPFRCPDKSDPYGSPGVSMSDMEFMLSERNLRRHDELMEALGASDEGGPAKRKGRP
ncbi:MAG: hypothetical protein JW793_10485 [Acidobacteria bacterium]|nr:hypothetical protein [Acidobacteriota bacterium]